MTSPDPRPPAPAGGLAVHPFRGLRFSPHRVADLAAVTSPPYDVVEPEAVLHLETSEPHNVVRLILPRPDSSGPEGRYRHAADTLRRWRADGVLVREPRPGYYVYEQSSGSTRQRGLLAAVALHPPATGVILPHEDVMPGPVQDRLALMSETRANLEPILLAHEGDDESGADVDAVLAAATEAHPVVDITTAAGERHRLWTLDAEPDMSTVRAGMRRRRALIADGHHRYAAYRALQARHRAAGAGPGPWDLGLALLVDADRYPLSLGSISRSVSGLALEPALTALDGLFRVERLPRGAFADPHRLLSAVAQQSASFAVVDGSSGALVSVADDAEVRSRVAGAVPVDRPSAYRRLDTTLLHAVVLPQLWKATESRVSYHHDPAAAIEAARVASGVAVLLEPVTLAEVLAVARAGATMPRKSTSFGPKPRTGLVLRSLDDG
jgi:uncharacterized protein (DUF1015 family)